MPLYAEITAEGYALIVAAIFAGLGGVMAAISSIVILVLGFLERGRSADRAAAVEQVKLTLQQNTAKQEDHAGKQDAKMDEGLKIQRATHTLVNLKTSKQLSTIRDDKRTIYELQPSDANKKALEVAERDLAEHLAQQAKVDAEYGTEATRMGTNPPAPKPAPADVRELQKAVAEVPDKTAEKVVEKIRDEEQGMTP